MWGRENSQTGKQRRWGNERWRACVRRDILIKGSTAEAMTLGPQSDTALVMAHFAADLLSL